MGKLPILIMLTFFTIYVIYGWYTIISHLRSQKEKTSLGQKLAIVLISLGTIYHILYINMMLNEYFI